MSYYAATTQALLDACQAGLAWADAIERDDGLTDIDQLYWHWLQLTRAAVAQATGQSGVTVG
jgi:hypothetical protein